MKLFVIYQFLPYPPTDGGALYVHNRLERLRQKHDLVLFAPTRRPGDPEAIDHLRAQGWQIETVSKPSSASKAKAVAARLQALVSPIPAHWALGWDDAICAEIEDQLRKHKPDVVVIEHLITSRFLSAVRRATDAPVVLCEQNVEYLWETRAARQFGATFNGFLRRWQARKVRQLERTVLEGSLLSFAISDHDRDLLRDLAPSVRIETLPAGVDVQFYSPDPTQEDGNKIVFTSSLNVGSNIDGARWLVEQVLPVVRRRFPDASVDLVGRDPAPSVRALASNPGVSVWADVPDTRPYIARAAVYAVPTWPDSGVRLKILEASAMGKAIVSTSKAAEGLDMVDGRNILIRDDPESFAGAIVHVLENKPDRHRLGEAAREFAVGFSWDASIDIFESHLTDALRRRHD